MIVLGVDGMDPQFVERHRDALPHLRRLHFERLRTTTPPQSPVAWSSFITGTDPAAHGIFDFVHRDPVTLQPFSSISRTLGARFALPLGPYRIPLSRARVEPLRKGRAFWEILAERGVPVTVIRMPTNYPPIPVGTALAGMGAPDLRGTFGTFTFFTDDPAEESREASGGRIVQVPPFQHRAVLRVEGPPNSLRKDEASTSVQMVVDVDPEEPAARIAVGDSMAIVKQGEWSDWLTAEFPLVRGLASVKGMFRIYAKQLHPRLEVYVSPVNVDPRSPELPISAPAGYSREVAREIGPFYTQGIAEDTSALRQGVLSLPEFLAQSRLVLDDERRMLRYALRHYRGGLLFFYFSAVDQNSHVLWGRHEAELLEIYRAVDASAGEVMQAVKDAELVVMSDHGFAAFDRAVNLNTWLWTQGFLRVRGSEVDWTATQAYALGLNGLYVMGGERQAVLEQIREQLLTLRDPENGRRVVESVAITPEGTAGSPPDLVVGYSPGYRVSWQTALGGIPAEVFEDNRDAWIGDHCIDASEVPGVLFSSREVRTRDPQLKDLTVSILSLFGAGRGAGMTGRELF